jgi:hypothetical protein
MAWLIGIGLIAAIGRLWWWSTGPVPNDIPDPGTLARMLRILMYRGVFRPSLQATLTICLRSEHERRLVFTKVIDEKGSPGFRAAFPREAWTVPFFDVFRNELDRRGVLYRETTVANAPVLTFDFGQDFGGAYVVTQVLFGALGARLHEDCVGTLRDVVIKNAPRLTGVDHPAEVWF